MKLPALSGVATSRDMVDAFGGYNHNLRIGNGEFYDTKNTTSSYYPLLSPRPKRGLYKEPTDTPITGIIEKDNLCYVKGNRFYFNDLEIQKLNLDVYDDKGEVIHRSLISMGAYVIIMPDKKYFNTADIDDCGDIEKKIEPVGKVKFDLCKMDGENYEVPTESIANPTAPDSPVNEQLWIDTSSVPHTLKQYSTSQEQWVSIPTTYIKITFSGYNSERSIPFKEGDGVTISGITAEGVTDLNNTMVVWASGDDYIVVTGILSKVVDQTIEQEGDFIVAKKMPDMDFVIESKNRLWGCKYGVVNGKAVNEIYASKLGDFSNWNCFSGISTDSYVISLGSDGVFTGAITHMGYPLFFKENCVHKVYGDTLPFGVQETACRGVQRGCHKSLSIVNEVLYYKSRSAICAYDGSLPVEISSALGDVSYYNASAGTLGNKYYISMADNEDTYHMFVYDTKMGLWHREDNTHASAFCTCRGNLYYIENDGKYSIKSVIGSGDTLITDDINWMAETGIIGVDMPDKKYISRIDVRLSLEVGARVFFYIQYDSMRTWEHLFTMTGTTLKSFPIPIKPKRCDHLRLRIEGIGEAKIFSICKTIEQGSDN